MSTSTVRERKTQLIGFRATPRTKEAIRAAAASLDKSMADFCHDTLWDKLEMMEMLPEGR